ncbi:MAG: prepilin peptidase [Micropepsaceae bacterium]
MTTIPLAIVLAIIAPFIGSFLSVLVVRLPRGENVVWGRSHCRSCDHTLGASELVPLVSWLVQAGKCRSCNAPVSALYPVMEMAALGVAIWAGWTVPEGALLMTVLLGWTLLALAVMDARDLFLSDWLTLPLIPAGLAVCWLLDAESIFEHFVAAALGYVALVSLAWLYRRVRGRDGLGLGDAKFLAGAGAWTGLGGLGSVLLIGVCVNVVFALAANYRGRQVEAETPLPLGTGIATGLWLTWLYGPILFTG